jgi:ribosome recycling factor
VAALNIKAMEQVDIAMSILEEGLEKCIEHTVIEFTKIRAGKATTNMLDGVMVEYYGNPTPLHQVANVNTPDARTLAIKPWEKNLIPDIETAIINANLGFAPQNDGESIRINIPALTEERRKELVKSVKSEAENSKVSIRSLRKDANEEIKSAQKDGLSEDNAKDAEYEIQKKVDAGIKRIDELIHKKEEEIMTI